MLIMNKNDVKANEKTSAAVGRICASDRRATSECDGGVVC